jgi:hypothetical protein
MQALQNVLVNDKYETESKMTAIIAMGDTCLASEQNFANFLSETMSSFVTAS